MKKGWLLVFFIIVISFEVNAAGLSPARVELPFKSDFTYEVPIEVINSYDVISDISLNIKGDLTPNVKLSADKLALAPLSSGKVIVTISLPSSLPRPGGYGIFLTAYEAPRFAAVQGISGNMAVTIMIIIRVPYPGKYMETTLSANDISEGGDVNILLSTTSKGKEMIEDVNGRIEVSDENGDKVMQFPVEQFSIKPEQTVDITKTFNLGSNIPGTYTVVSVLNYDGLYAATTTNFRVGTMLVRLVNATEKIEQGKINRFDMLLENRWNEVIRGVYAEITMLNNNQEIIKIQTPSIDILPFDKKPLLAYIDTTGIAVGVYDAKIDLFYQGKITTETIKIKVYKNLEINPINILIAVIILIIIIDVIVVMRRKMHYHAQKASINANFGKKE